MSDHPSDDFGHDPEPPRPGRKDDKSLDAAKGCAVWVVIAAILWGVFAWLQSSSQNESQIERKPRFVPAVIHKGGPEN